MRRCRICGREVSVSKILGICADCIRSSEEALPYIIESHQNARLPYDLPIMPPREKGISCNLCSNKCRISEGKRGYCGLRWNKNGKFHSEVSGNRALLYSYLDPHITNCCAAWFCPATGRGYPRYSYRKSGELGYYNYAVFFYGCNFSCLFCQNYSHKNLENSQLVDISDFTHKIKSNGKISCVCYFGGSPEPQLPFVIRASRKILEEADRLVRICMEWNGCGNKNLVKKLAKISLESGGIIKFDLKTFSPTLSLALSGVSNEEAYKNFEMIYHNLYEERKEVPLLTATTLLVPGYVDEKEVEGIARFISDLDRDIPYSLLVFHPQFYMKDLSVTPFSQVKKCLETSKKYLNNVHVGNLHLLGLYKSLL